MRNIKFTHLTLAIGFLFAIAAAEAGTYRCRKNKHRCGWSVPTVAPRAQMARDYKFFGKADYQHYWGAAYNQVNKLYGTSDCGSLNKHAKSAMIGFRHIDGTREIELLGYVHSPYFKRGKYNFAHAHLGTVRIDDYTNLVIRPDSSSYVFQKDSKEFLIMPRACDRRKMLGAKIGTWFGGQRPSPVRFNIRRKKLSRRDQQNRDKHRIGHFPKYVNIADKDICKINNVGDELKRRAPETHRSMTQACDKTIVFHKVGCDDRFELETAGTKTSPNSLKAAKIEVQCKEVRPTRVIKIYQGPRRYITPTRNTSSTRWLTRRN